LQRLELGLEIGILELEIGRGLLNKALHALVVGKESRLSFRKVVNAGQLTRLRGSWRRCICARLRTTTTHVGIRGSIGTRCYFEIRDGTLAYGRDLLTWGLG